MNELQKVFNYAGKEVRTIIREGETWFVAKDVCEILEIANPTMALKRLDNDEVTKLNLGGLYGETNLINEAGLYTLILGSRKQEAREFKRWVTHEVLPSIRKHGAYMTENTLEQAITNPDFMIGLLTNLKEEQQKRIAAEEKTSLLEPKARKYEEFLDAEGLTTVTIVGNYLGGISAQKLRKFLQEQGVLSRKKVNGTYMPKKGYEKYFRIIPYLQADGNGAMRTVSYTLKVTNAGIDLIFDLYLLTY
ncbi:phage antirepressor [Metabacillus bambusae]|uniref:Phage antirepressor n=1 Tax=Metabacillus bambusae TaxID=2795218 RepID=A0ABS3N6N0_9BACI|nr:phage antirepressor [Metabacillus bambusae]MBO1513700.1 phage antirepressor [Metabacillus bambusae]